MDGSRRAEIGRLGEGYAAADLMKKGYAILERNYHSRYGEIDIIAADAEYIVFVEVRVRALGGLTDPGETLTRQKQQKIVKTAMVYLMDHEGALQPRFDFYAIGTKGRQIVAAEHLEDAFQAFAF